MDFTDILFQNLDWIYVAKNNVQLWVTLNTIMKYQVPFLDWLDDYQLHEAAVFHVVS
jgi:hypothetical protein